MIKNIKINIKCIVYLLSNFYNDQFLFQDYPIDFHYHSQSYGKSLLSMQFFK